jgi:hypothetical protein
MYWYELDWSVSEEDVYWLTLDVDVLFENIVRYSLYMGTIAVNIS